MFPQYSKENTETVFVLKFMECDYCYFIYFIIFIIIIVIIIAAAIVIFCFFVFFVLVLLLLFVLYSCWLHNWSQLFDLRMYDVNEWGTEECIIVIIIIIIIIITGADGSALDWGTILQAGR
jgi:hypothetical protein